MRGQSIIVLALFALAQLSALAHFDCDTHDHRCDCCPDLIWMADCQGCDDKDEHHHHHHRGKTHDPLQCSACAATAQIVTPDSDSPLPVERLSTPEIVPVLIAGLQARITHTARGPPEA
jgi:hypothetical protein